MHSLNKSFAYGVIVASITWFVCIYLYYQLNLSERITNNLHNTFAASANHQIANAELQPVAIDDLMHLSALRSIADKEQHEYGYKIHAFNALLSDRIELNRNIPDTRHMLCKTKNYDVKQLPKVSIVMCFYNEHNSTLLRSITSILQRSPAHLLHEIILVDDFSDKGELREHIERFQRTTDKVRYFRTERREGIMRARLFGARQTRDQRGQILVFLDSHVEVNVDWLPPLLAHVQAHRKAVAMPIIDIIKADTFQYTSSPLVRGAFNWALHFKWENLPKGTLSVADDFVKPIKSPTMSGGLFAIDRAYFFDAGAYDAGMNIWGGENIEMSFRIWMCGGQLDIIPCSRVGHVFRQRRPYGAPDGQDTMMYNSMRVANVWMDEYKAYFLKEVKQDANFDCGYLESRIQLRTELNCSSFKWYLEHVYPELAVPDGSAAHHVQKFASLETHVFQPWHSRKRNYVRQFQVRLSDTNFCAQSAKDIKTKGSLLQLRPCIRGKQQIWYETDKHEFVLAQLLCLQARQPEPNLYKCHEMGGDQDWQHKGEKQSPIFNMAAGMCLGVRKATVDAIVIMTLCNEPLFNKWDLIET